MQATSVCELRDTSMWMQQSVEYSKWLSITTWKPVSKHSISPIIRTSAARLHRQEDHSGQTRRSHPARLAALQLRAIHVSCKVLSSLLFEHCISWRRI